MGEKMELVVDVCEVVSIEERAVDTWRVEGA